MLLILTRNTKRLPRRVSKLQTPPNIEQLKPLGRWPPLTDDPDAVGALAPNGAVVATPRRRLPAVRDAGSAATGARLPQRRRARLAAHPRRLRQHDAAPRLPTLCANIKVTVSKKALQKRRTLTTNQAASLSLTTSSDTTSTKIHQMEWTRTSIFERRANNASVFSNKTILRTFIADGCAGSVAWSPGRPFGHLAVSRTGQEPLRRQLQVTHSVTHRISTTRCFATHKEEQILWVSNSGFSL